MDRVLRLICSVFVVAFLVAVPCRAEDAVPAAGDAAAPANVGITHVLRGEQLARSGDPFSAITEYRKAIAAGYHGSDVYRSLSTVLYLAGFPDEAINVLKEAVRLHPKEVFPRLELGVLYFATERQDEAKKLFLEVLSGNPTLANAYYYLAVISYRQKGYDDAWLYIRRAQLLGHKDQSLVEKLKKVSTEPAIDPRKSLSDQFCFRQILVDTYEKAEKIRKRIMDGEMFEVVAGMESSGPSAVNGGFVGCLAPDELDARLGAALWHQKAYGDPVVAETYQGAHVLQRVLPFDPQDWQFQLAALKHPVVAAAKGSDLVKVPTVVGAHDKAPEGRYSVHAGSYSGPMLASTMVSRLREAKLPAFFYTSTTKTGKLVYRVLAGRYDDRRQAERASDILSNMGINNFIVNTSQKGNGAVEDDAGEPAAAAAHAEPAKQAKPGKSAKPAKSAKSTESAKPAAAAQQHSSGANDKTVLALLSTMEKEAAGSGAGSARSQPSEVTEEKLPGEEEAAVPAPPPAHAAPVAAAKAPAAVPAHPTPPAAPAPVVTSAAAPAHAPAPVATAPRVSGVSAELVVEKKSDEPSGKFTVHVGSVATRELAEKKVAALRQAGFPAFSYVLVEKGNTVYRLVGGRYDDYAAARAASRALASHGVKSFIANTK